MLFLVQLIDLLLSLKFHLCRGVFNGAPPKVKKKNWRIQITFNKVKYIIQIFWVDTFSVWTCLFRFSLVGIIPLNLHRIVLQSNRRLQFKIVCQRENGATIEYFFCWCYFFFNLLHTFTTSYASISMVPAIQCYDGWYDHKLYFPKRPVQRAACRRWAHTCIMSDSRSSYKTVSGIKNEFSCKYMVILFLCFSFFILFGEECTNTTYKPSTQPSPQIKMTAVRLWWSQWWTTFLLHTVPHNVYSQILYIYRTYMVEVYVITIWSTLGGGGVGAHIEKLCSRARSTYEYDVVVKSIYEYYYIYSCSFLYIFLVWLLLLL